jgi:cysteinyl-tRNA synthetase
VLFDLARELNSAARSDPARARALAAELKGFGAIFGILQEDPTTFRRGGSDGGDAAEIDALVAARTQAKLARDYARADAIRQELLERGVVLEDTREGTLWRRA